MEVSNIMKKNVIVLFIALAFFCLLSFMSFATNSVVEVQVPDGTELERVESQSVIPNLLGGAGGETAIPVSDDDYIEKPFTDEEDETYKMPNTTATYVYENDPFTIYIVDSEGNTKEKHLPYPDITIDYDKVDYKKAKYHYVGDDLVINYGNDTYVVSGKDDFGFYTTVTENGRKYSIERYQKIAGIDNYLYKGQEYEVDEEGYMVGYRREWVLSDYTDYDGEKIGNYEDTKLLFRKEVPFNILWKHRPLSDEEKELLYSGPGAGLKNFSTGLSQDGSAKVVMNRKPEVGSVDDTGTEYTKNKVLVIDPLDPMKAKSTKKKKKKEE